MKQSTFSGRELPKSIMSSVLSGPFEGKADVYGHIPSWLCGQLIRTAPAIFEWEKWHAEHWFDALGMLYSFDINADGTVSWMQRLLECEFNRSILQGRDELGSFGTRSRRSFIQRLLQPIARSTDNTNVNIQPAGRHWIAMTETQRQLAIDPASLKTHEEVRFTDTLPNNLLVSAHPQNDSARKELINIGIHYGARSALVVFAQPYGSRTRREIGRIPLNRVPYIHSFATTQSKIVLIFHPYDLQPLRMLWSARPISEQYRWSPDSGTRILIMDKRSGQFTEHWGPAFFFFHIVNAFYLPGGLVNLELMGFNDAKVIQQGMLMRSIRREGLPSLTPTLRRIMLDSDKKDFQMRDVGPEAAFEFPTIHYRCTNGRPHRYIWGSDLSSLLKIDTSTDRAQRRSLDDMTFGEPIFVGRPEAAEEDDGVLLTVGSCHTKQESAMTIWDATSLEILAQVTVPVTIPMGFHGSFKAR